MADVVGFDAARDELYGLEPEQFLARRAELVASVRASDAVSAKRIGALRKPTRAAYAVNMLVRAQPDALERIEALAQELRDAQRSLAADRIREATQRRNKLVGELAGQALTAAGIQNAPIGLRDDIMNTVSAALADAAVRDELRSGAMVRSARWDGLGEDLGPALSLVPPMKAAGKGERSAGAGGAPGGAADGPVNDSAEGAAGDASDDVGRKTADRAEQRRRARQQELAEQLELAHAAMRDADARVTECQRAVRTAERELADARRVLDDAMLDARMAQRRLDAAQQAVDKATR